MWRRGLNIFFLLFVLSAYASDPVVPVAVTQIESTTLQEKLFAIGTLTSRETSYAQSEDSGRIENILVSEGDVVTQGQVLAELDAKLANAALQGALANLEKVNVALVNQRQTLNRVEQLAKTRAASQSTLQAETARYKSLLNDRIVAQSQVVNAEFRVHHTKITAPIAGVVQEKKVAEGSLVEPGTPAFLIVNPKQLQAILPFPQQQRNFIQVGQTVELISPNSRQPVYAIVSQIKPMIEQANRSFQVIVNFKNPGDWHPGTSVQAYVYVQQPQAVWVVPQTSLVVKDHQTLVFIVENQHVRSRSVTIVRQTEKNVLVTGDLKPGETVVCDGAAYLVDGEAVEIQKDKPCS